MSPAPVSPAWAETAFQVVNTLVLPGWLILFFAPRWKFGAWLVSGVIIPGVLAVAYLGLVVASMGMPGAAGPEAFLTLAGVMTLFDNPVGVVAGWTHYLVFDMAIGAWEVRDSSKKRDPAQVGCSLPVLHSDAWAGRIFDVSIAPDLANKKNWS